MKTPAATPSGRLAYLDLIRGFFILVMIEGHTLRALLSPAVQAGVIYRAVDLIHNITGPAFLFASGVSFVYATRPRWESYRRWGPPLRGRLRRWLVVLAAGYALQLTYGTLRRSLDETTPDQMAFLLSSNILQCIVIALFLLQLLILLVPDWKWFFRVAVLLAAGIGFLAPWAWNAGPDTPLWLGSWISGRTKSVFPLFPYAGFTLAGAAWGYRHMLAREESEENTFLRRSNRFCFWLCLGSIAVALLPLPEMIYSDFWYTSPLFFLLRVGILCLVAAGVRRLESRLLPRFEILAVVDAESLVIYVLHLVVLYGSAFNPDTSLVKWLGQPLPTGNALAVWLLFTVALIVFAVWWDWWKRGARTWQLQGVRWTLAGYFTYAFLLG